MARMSKHKDRFSLVAILSIAEIAWAAAICAVFHAPLKGWLFFIGIAVIHSIVNIVWATRRE